MTNTEQLGDFLDSLYGEIEGSVSVWWRRDAGSKNPYSKSAWFEWPRQRAEMINFIESVSDKDVCVTTATYGERRRIPEHVQKTQTIWMDSDVCNGENYRVAPTWTVSTSRGRWQHFWALSEPVDAFRASDLVHKISFAHDKQGADQSSWPANKIMRVPGTKNTSHGFPTTVTATSSGLIYAIEELEAAYQDVEVVSRALVREIPELSEDELPAYGNVLAKLDSDLVDLATAEPKEDQDRSRLRYKLLLELFRFGLSYEEVLSVAWAAPASRKWSEEDDRGLSGLASEAVKAAAEAGTPRAEPVDPYGEDSDPRSEMALDKAVVILTDEERAVAEATPNFVTRYLAYADSRLSHDNRAYDRLNAWMIMALAYGDAGFVLAEGQTVRPNFFGCTLGETTTGKTSSFRLKKTVLRELFHDDPEFNIGGNASETALVRTLHGRDGKISYFNSDEAAGVFKVWTGMEWSSGLQERITELYDGEVNPLLRSGKGESVTTTSVAIFNVFLAGTQKGVMNFVTPALFETGFVPRFLFAVGEPRRNDYDSYALNLGSKNDALQGFDPVARDMAVRMRETRQIVREFHGGPCPITVSPEAHKRLHDATWDIDREYNKHPQWDMIGASLFRWRDNVLRAALCLAIDARRTEITLLDMLQALAAGEEWMTNQLRIITQLSANTFERNCTEIYQFVSRRGGRVGRRSVFKQFSKFSEWEMGNFIRTLTSQGRVWEGKENGRDYYYSDAHST